MNVALGDWALLAFLAVFVPVWGWFDHRSFLRRERAADTDILSAEYIKTIGFHAVMAGSVLGTWFVLGRDWTPLGFTPLNLSGHFWIGSLIAGALLMGMVLNFLGGMVSGKGDAARIKAYAKLAPFLPKTGRQHRWGMALSVSAGIAEEIAYRGFVMWLLAFFMPVYAVIAVQAIIFGLAHAYQGWGGAVGTAILGAVIGVVYWATGSLFLPIMLHMLVDAMSLSVAYFTFRRQAGREAGV
ncbi:CPBP family intramembrane glutamic endopeptidase [Hyphomonas johnsonii]|uniref:CAAX amino protease n=1 Tax=Hyphomonas johnsonii MHS-2 TaxID=1280950 RepID=A0A059FUE8_9PROT|nr:type II CAAX endopeptidase family protein [Hyphomonas johnsonii]KCZ94043.1 CAAX amino protease [Hyphomonas johnsonii MHS-2]